MSLRSSGLRAHVRFTAKATELLRRREMTRCAKTGNQQDDAKVMAACRRPQPDALFRFALTAALQARFTVPAKAPKNHPVEKQRISIIRFIVTETTGSSRVK
jgi:hypothetical protein